LQAVPELPRFSGILIHLFSLLFSQPSFSLDLTVFPLLSDCSQQFSFFPHESWVLPEWNIKKFPHPNGPLCHLLLIRNFMGKIAFCTFRAI
jgi:hypothetical protein